MPALESHTGLLRQTIPYYNRRSFVNISNRNQYYAAFPAIQRNAKRMIAEGAHRFNFGLPVEVTMHGGTDFRFNIQVDSGDTFAWVDMNDPINISQQDFEVQATVVKRHCRDHWTYNKIELAAARGPEQITALTTTRALGRDQGFADSFENWFWGTPPASTDNKTAWPLRYWLFSEPESTVGSYTTYTGILTGADGNFLNVNHNSYTSGPGGVSRVTYPMWGNANAQYTTFDDTDAVDKISDMMLQTHFISPVDFPDMVKGPPDRAMYTTKATIRAKAQLARQQNDANTSDVAYRLNEGAADVFRVPMYWVPALDLPTFSLYSSSSQDVIYGVDWTTFYWLSVSGFTLKDEILEPSLEAPLHYTHVRYLSGNLCCINPRQNWVLSK